ncbi:MAG: sulfotransferase family protein [Pseudomonadota bacterium]
MTLKVIGAGFGRTGTASLKLALETLLGGPCYHMSEVLAKPGQMDLWLDAAAGHPNWDAIFEGYTATVDFPASNYWEELAAAFPDAKIILSVRDAERWFQSTQETIFGSAIQTFAAGTKWGQMSQATIDDRLGGNLNDKDEMIAVFNAHNARVKAAFAPDRLLVFEAKDGWGPLCKFLGVPEPEGDYPHINSKEEFDSVLAMLGSPMGAKAMNGEGLGGMPGGDVFVDKD